MLTTNIRINRENAFKDTYCGLVAERLDLPKWCYPNKSKARIPGIIDNCISCGVYTAEQISSFVKAQFNYFDYNVCLKLFRMKYPPVSVFLTPNARQRYRKNVLLEESFTPSVITDEMLLLIINKETANNKPGLYYAKKDKINFALISGNLSVYTLAYSMLKNIVPLQMAKDCVSYSKQCVTEDMEQNYYRAVERVAKMLNCKGVFHV